MSLYRNYKIWVRQHADALSLAETCLSSITWLLPERFEGNEILLEGIHSLANIFGAFNETILSDIETRGPVGAQELTLALNALQQFEVLVEIFALNSSNWLHRYDALLGVELMKLLVRLGLYSISGQRIVLQGGLGFFSGSVPLNTASKPRRVLTAFDTFRRRHLKHAEEDVPAIAPSSKGGERVYWWDKHRVTRFSPTAKSLSRRKDSQVFEDMRVELEESSKVCSMLLVAGEILHMIRPVLYVASLRMYGRRSWRPWILSLLIDATSQKALDYACQHSQHVSLKFSKTPDLSRSTISALYANQGIVWNRDEMDEITRRKLLLLFYLIRDPLFASMTRPVIQRLVSVSRRVPLLPIGWISERLVDLLDGIQKYYTYTSAS